MVHTHVPYTWWVDGGCVATMILSCQCTRLYTCIQRICIDMSAHMPTHASAHMSVHKYAHMSAHMSVHISTHIHVHMSIHTAYTHVHILHVRMPPHKFVQTLMTMSLRYIHVTFWHTSRSVCGDTRFNACLHTHSTTQRLQTMRALGTGYNYIGHNSIGHTCTGHNCIGHNSIDRYYVTQSTKSGSTLRQ